MAKLEIFMKFYIIDDFTKGFDSLCVKSLEIMVYFKCVLLVQIQIQSRVFFIENTFSLISDCHFCFVIF